MKKHQGGYMTLLLSSVLSAGLALAGVASTTGTNMNIYHSDNKAKIEEAQQLAEAGLSYVRYLLDGQINYNPRMQAFIDRHKNDPAVAYAQCRYGADNALPDELIPRKTVETISTPNADQKIEIRVFMAPYNCNMMNLDDINYRAVFEVIGSTNCANNNEECVTRSITYQTYNATEDFYITYKEPDCATCPPKGDDSNGGGVSM